MYRDFILDDNNDLKIEGGDFVIAESTMQEVGLIIAMNPGELKSDPILGLGLISKVKSSISLIDITADLKKHLKRDDKNYHNIKQKLKFNLKSL